jgi:type I restriction enzyme S subunit
MKLVRLGDLASIQTGKIDVNKAVVGGKYPFFTCSRDLYEINEAPFEGKAVLVAGNGYLNVKYYEGKFNAYQRTYVLFVNNENELIPKYLYWFLESYVGQLRSESIGSTIKYIKMGNLTEAVIPLPSLERQRRIIEKLDSAFAEIDSLERNLESIESLINEYDTSILSRTLNSNIEDLEMQRDSSLGNVTELISRGISPTYFDSANTVVLNQRCIRDGRVDLNFSRRHNEKAKKVQKAKLLQNGDGLINSTGVGTLGRTALFEHPGIGEITVDSHVTIVRPKSDILDSGYFGLVLKALENIFVSLSTGTSGQTELPREAIKDTRITFPHNLSDQKNFFNYYNSVNMAISEFRKALINKRILSKTLRASLLNNAFSEVEEVA